MRLMTEQWIHEGLCVCACDSDAMQQRRHSLDASASLTHSLALAHVEPRTSLPSRSRKSTQEHNIFKHSLSRSIITMADEYNAQLKPGAWRGRCGAPEIIDDEDSLQRKIEQLVTLIRGARHVVVHTGAGISTAAGIADFRGPNGVWTKDLEEKRRRAAEARKRKRKSHGTRADDNNDDDAATTTSNDSASQPTPAVQQASAAPSSDSPACSTSSGTQPSSPSAPVRFENAIPTKTHMALVALHRASILKLVVTQNIDNLHLASGLPHSALAELHGNIFREMCEQVRPLGLGYNLAQEILVLIKRGPALRSRQCGTDYFRDYSIPSVGFKYTGRVCEEPGCTGRLRDCTLDWDDALPPQALKLAEVPHHTRARQRHASSCSHMCACVRVTGAHSPCRRVHLHG